MFEQVFQIVSLILSVVASTVATIWGFKSVTRNVDDKLAASMRELHEAIRLGLQSKVDVSVYAAKTKELHDKNNNLEKNQAALEREVKTLKELVSMVIKQEL